MLKILIKINLLLVFLLIIKQVAFAQWNYVGTPTISDGWTTNNQIACLADGTPIISYTRQNTAYCKIWNGTDWESLGAELSTVNAELCMICKWMSKIE
jgi:hypothetical protein